MKYINIHTHTATEKEDVISVVNLRAGYDSADQNSAGFVSYGIHPWDSGKTNIIEYLDNINDINSLIIIGECGLDKMKGAPLEKQKWIFEKQILLSEALHKPLIIHCVGLFNEIITINKAIEPLQTWIIHGFNAHKHLAQQLIKNGFMLSFGAAILDKHSKAATAIKAIPVDSFFLETDDSSYEIETIYNAAAELRGTTVKNLKQLIFSNYQNLFKLSNGVAK